MSSTLAGSNPERRETNAARRDALALKNSSNARCSPARIRDTRTRSASYTLRHPVHLSIRGTSLDVARAAYQSGHRGHRVVSIAPPHERPAQITSRSATRPVYVCRRVSIRISVPKTVDFRIFRTVPSELDLAGRPSAPDRFDRERVNGGRRLAMADEAQYGVCGRKRRARDLVQ